MVRVLKTKAGGGKAAEVKGGNYIYASRFIISCVAGIVSTACSQGPKLRKNVVSYWRTHIHIVHIALFFFLDSTLGVCREAEVGSTAVI